MDKCKPWPKGQKFRKGRIYHFYQRARYNHMLYTCLLEVEFQGMTEWGAFWTVSGVNLSGRCFWSDKKDKPGKRFSIVYISSSADWSDSCATEGAIFLGEHPKLKQRITKQI